MSEVWCVFAHAKEAAINLAEVLLADGHSVALIANDVSPFAMLVNSHADHVFPIEIADLDLRSLTDAVFMIEESLGGVDTVAITCAEHERALAEQSRAQLADRWPGVDVLVVTDHSKAPA